MSGRRSIEMTSISHEHSPLPEKASRTARPRVPEMWASLAIAATWITVCVDALFGPDIVSTSGTGLTKIPSAVVLAVFAWLATRVIARYGFSERRTDD
jgi:hypothetical protein